MPEQNRVPFKRLIVEKHAAFPSRVEQMFVRFGNLIRFNQLGVVPQDHGSNIQRSKVALFVLKLRGKKLALRRVIGVNRPEPFDSGRLFRAPVYDVHQVSAGTVFCLNFVDLRAA